MHIETNFTVQASSAQEEHQTGRHWKRGGPSPNPKGRPPGIIDKRSRIARAFMEDGAEIAKVVVAAAKAGDLQAAALVLNRIQPVLKARADTVAFALDTTAAPATQAEQVLAAVSAGQIDPETGKLVIDCINACSVIREVDELQSRIEALEAHAAGTPAAPGNGSIVEVA